MARQGQSRASPAAAVVTASGSGQCAAGIFSITFVAIAAAALSGCHSGIPVADAFVARSAAPCSGKRASNLFTATAGQEAQAGFLEDAFNGEKEADGGASAAATVVAAGACSIDDGQVQGPAEVLVYDTSLRGECFSFIFVEWLLCRPAFLGFDLFEVTSSTLCTSYVASISVWPVVALLGQVVD